MTVGRLYLEEDVDSLAAINVYVNKEEFENGDIAFISDSYMCMSPQILTKEVKEYKVVNRFNLHVLV